MRDYSLEKAEAVATALRSDIIALRTAVREKALARDELDKRIRDLMMSFHGEDGEDIGGVRAIEAIIREMAGRQGYEGEGGPGQTALYKICDPVRRLEKLFECAQNIAWDLPRAGDGEDGVELRSQFDDLLKLAQRMAADITLHISRAYDVLKEHPLPMRLRDVTEKMRFSLGHQYQTEQKEQLYKVAKLLADGGKTPAQIARFFEAGLWENLATAPPIAAGDFSGRAVRYEGHSKQLGSIISKDSADDLAQKYLAVYEGEPGPDTVIVQCKRTAAKMAVRDIEVGMTVWLPGDKARTLVLEKTVEGQQVTLTCNARVASKAKPITVTLSGETVLETLSREILRHIPKMELERGRARYALVLDGRYSTLMELARQRLETDAAKAVA